MTNLPTGSFDANQFKPQQSVETPPPGRHDFQISNTSIVPTKDGQGGMFVVNFTTPHGMISNRYNIWNQSPKAVEIAHHQLSALCHAVGIFRLDWQNEGAALRGARGKIDVGHQKGEEPTAERPQGGYVEVKRVLDVNGNEPGKGPAPGPQTTTQWAGTQTAQQEQPKTVANPAWGAQNPQGEQANPQSGNADGRPPWANKS
jgi:hypothetical protein